METANRKLRDLLDLWDEKRGVRSMPVRGDLGVRTLKPWLGNLALIDVSERGEAVFRLCGTRLYIRFGGDATHRSLTALEADIGDSLQDGIERVCRTRAPAELWHERRIGDTPQAFSELCLPLSDGTTEVRSLLFASYPVAKE